MGKGVEMLGKWVKDDITPLEGTVVGWIKYLSGCVRVQVQPAELKDGVPVQPQWLDVGQVTVVKKPKQKVDGPPGGPRSDPVARRDPS